MGDGRKTQRHRVLKVGTISFGGGGITCTVRNLSDTGAALDVTSPWNPRQFHLGAGYGDDPAALPSRLAEGKADWHCLRGLRYVDRHCLALGVSYQALAERSA